MGNSKPRLQGKIALIMGSTSGIGLAIAERLAQDGAKVIVSSRRKKNVEDTVKNFRDKGYDVEGIICHIADRENRRNLVEKLEKYEVLDIFVQCVGANTHIGPILNCSEEEWDKMFDLNLKTSFLLTKELLHLLKKSKCGRVVYNSSLTAYAQYEKLGVYSVSKIALVGFTKNVALHLGRYNITVNCIVPGIINTPFGEVMVKDKYIKMIVETTSAVKRFGEPKEVAGIVAFLASEESSYISGEAIFITGGVMSRL